MNINHSLKCEVHSPLNVRHVRYFISKKTVRESNLVSTIRFTFASLLDITLCFLYFLFSKDTWVSDTLC